jgi:hypothetical protein
LSGDRPLFGVLDTPSPEDYCNVFMRFDQSMSGGKLLEHCKQERVIAGLEANLNNLNGWQKRQNGSIKDINDTLKEIQKDIEAIKLAIATPRGPSWAVALIIAALSTISTSLIVFVATKMGGG